MIAGPDSEEADVTPDMRLPFADVISKRMISKGKQRRRAKVL